MEVEFKLRDTLSAQVDQDDKKTLHLWVFEKKKKTTGCCKKKVTYVRELQVLLFEN